MVRAVPGTSFLGSYGAIQQAKGQVEKALQETTTASKQFETQVARQLPEAGQKEFVEAEYKAAMAKVTEKINYFQDKINKINDDINRIDADKSLKSITRNERITSLQEDKKGYTAQQKAWNEFAGKDKATVIRGVTTGQVEDLASYYKEKIEASRQQKQII
jgi:hypothetical protein